MNALIIAAAALHINCAPAPEVMNGLSAKYGERPVWTGSGQNGRYVLLESRKGTWTIILMPTPDVACGVGSGINSKAMFGDPA